MYRILDLRKKSGMTRSEFCEYLEIPYRTLQNWELGIRECPDYLIKLIEFKLTASGKIDKMQ